MVRSASGKIQDQQMISLIDSLIPENYNSEFENQLYLGSSRFIAPCGASWLSIHPSARPGFEFEIAGIYSETLLDTTSMAFNPTMGSAYAIRLNNNGAPDKVLRMYQENENFSGIVSLHGLNDENWIIQLSNYEEGTFAMEDLTGLQPQIQSVDLSAQNGVAFLIKNCQGEVTGELEFERPDLTSRVVPNTMDEEGHLYFSITGIFEPLDINPHGEPVMIAPALQGNISYLVCYNNPSTSIEDSPASVKFSMFPNPANEKVTPGMPHAGPVQPLEILDAHGQRVYLKSLLKSNRLTIGLRQWSPGFIYRGR